MEKQEKIEKIQKFIDENQQVIDGQVEIPTEKLTEYKQLKQQSNE